MSLDTTSVPAPGSIEAQAIAELEKEGHVIEGKEPAPADPAKEPTPPKEEPEAEEPKKEEPKADPVPEKKPERSPTMVEAWKLRVAEDQKESALKQVSELSEQIKKLSEQKSPVTVEQKDDIAEEIKKIAEETGVDAAPLTKLAEVILKRNEPAKNSNDLEKIVQQLKEERELEKQLNEYSNEFEKDILPLIGQYQLSGDALSQLKNTLRDYAFSETYAKVPLKEIFAIKKESLNLSEPKKSSEGKAVKARASDGIIDIDNITEEEFAKLPPDKIEEFASKKSSGSWQRR